MLLTVKIGKSQLTAYSQGFEGNHRRCVIKTKALRKKKIVILVFALLTITSIGMIVYSRSYEEEPLQWTSNFNIIHVIPELVTTDVENEIDTEAATFELEETTPLLPTASQGNPFAPQVIQRDISMRILTDDYVDDSNDLHFFASTTVHTVQSLGIFELTAYCLCIICTEHYSYQHPRNANNPNFTQRTAGGTIPRAGRTVAVDPRIIPFGSRILINGQTYLAEDRGGAIMGRIIDIFMDSHQTALEFGRREAEVFLILD